MSYFGRINYNYRSKYMLEAQGRYDGSSKFQPEKPLGVLLGYLCRMENFGRKQFMKNLTFVDELEAKSFLR